MKHVDVSSLTWGLVFIAIAVMAFCGAFSTLNWGILGIVCPIVLVLIGLVGLGASGPHR